MIVVKLSIRFVISGLSGALSFGAACLLLPASAHASSVVTPAELTAGKGGDVTVGIKAEGGSPTTRVVVGFDDPVVNDANAQDLPQWSSTLERNDDQSVKSLEWSKGSIAPGSNANFVFYAVAPTNTQQLNLTITQASANGNVTRTPIVLKVAGATGPSAGASNAGNAAGSATQATGAPTSASDGQHGTKKGFGGGSYLLAFGVVVLFIVFFRGRSLTRKNSRDDVRRPGSRRTKL